LWIRKMPFAAPDSPHPKSLSLMERDFEDSSEPLALRERGRGEGKLSLSIIHVKDQHTALPFGCAHV
jgi:hypothetical protein